MVLKGYACSLNWPKPQHRPCGDIDIWLFGKQKEADAVLEKEKPVQVCQGGQKVKIDKSHHHHSVFEWDGFTVENHYDFINVHHHRSNLEIDKLFKELATDDSCSVDVYGEKVYLPSPNLHALFLLRHAMNHFASSEISLRQLLDWTFFVKRHGKEVDWKWLDNELEYYGMSTLVQVFNAICVEEFGFGASLFPKVQFNPFLKDRVLDEILEPAFNVKEPSFVLSRIAFKYRRWKANEWKHELCYKDSMWSAFWSGVWSHFLMPNSI